MSNQITSKFSALEKKALSGLSAKEIETAIKLLKKIYFNLEERE